jgi:hypothetical protein
VFYSCGKIYDVFVCVGVCIHLESKVPFRCLSEIHTYNCSEQCAPTDNNAPHSDGTGYVSADNI